MTTISPAARRATGTLFSTTNFGNCICGAFTEGSFLPGGLGCSIEGALGGQGIAAAGGAGASPPGTDGAEGAVGRVEAPALGMEGVDGVVGAVGADTGWGWEACGGGYAGCAGKEGCIGVLPACVPVLQPRSNVP